VVFGHDTERALAVAVALVNTPPSDLATLQEFVRTHDISGTGRPRRADVDALRTLAGRLRAVFEAEDETAAAEGINALLADYAATPQLTAHDGYALHLHHFAPGAAVADHLGADCGMALAVVVADGERSRLRRCEGGCGRVLVDLSRNRNRRFCADRACGNRLHAAAYRARHRDQAGTA
jgi:predicted RNA-binding Zn ribbon-like protein